jgi:hypothetical protein
MRRLSILARYRKASTDPNRGSDIFGRASTASETQRRYSEKFLQYLLYYMKVWGKKFGIGPDGKPSKFNVAYNSLTKENVAFPTGNVEAEDDEDTSERRFPAPQRHSLNSGSIR